MMTYCGLCRAAPGGSGPAARAEAAGGTYMFLRGLLRRGLHGRACRWVGLGLLTRSVANCPFTAMAQKVKHRAEELGHEIAGAAHSSQRPEITRGGEDGNGSMA